MLQVNHGDQEVDSRLEVFGHHARVWSWSGRGGATDNGAYLFTLF